MKIVEESRTHVPITRVEAGDYLEFVYNGKRREVVVVTTDWNDNLDAYEVTDLDHEELLHQKLSSPGGNMPEGHLWTVFQNGSWPFKSFKRNKIHAPVRVQFRYEEEKSAKTKTSQRKTADTGRNGNPQGT